MDGERSVEDGTAVPVSSASAQNEFAAAGQSCCILADRQINRQTNTQTDRDRQTDRLTD